MGGGAGAGWCMSADDFNSLCWIVQIHYVIMQCQYSHIQEEYE